MAMVELSALDISKLNDTKLWRWIHGGPFEFWETNQIRIETFVKENNISPAPQISPANVRTARADIPLDAKEILDHTWKYGGRKAPHLHCNGEIYLLDAKQWQEFSGSVVKDIHRKLEESGSIRFNELLDISDAVANL